MPEGIWLLLVALLPVAAASGWFARSRAGVSGSDQSGVETPRATDYMRGLNYLANNEADRAIELFVQMLKVDDDTVETHLALGNLFRRQGEVDRALRLHENLVARPNLASAHRNQARFELAQDYLRAGVLDRAEEMFLDLSQRDIFVQRSLQFLATIYEQEREWLRAIEVTQRLERVRGLSSATVIAQYYCEAAELARDASDLDAARGHLVSAVVANNGCARASMIAGAMAEAAGEFRQAARRFEQVLDQDASFASEVILPLRRCYEALDDIHGYARFLARAREVYSGPQPQVAYARLLDRQGRTDEAIAHLSHYLQHQPNWIGFYHLLDITWGQSSDGLTGTLNSLRVALAQMIERQPAYRCGQCGFSGRYLHWQCPSCRSWSTVTPLKDVQPGNLPAVAPHLGSFS